MSFAGGAQPPPPAEVLLLHSAQFSEPADRAQVPLAPAAGCPQAPGTFCGKSDLML